MDKPMPGSIIYTNNPLVEIRGDMTLRDYFAAKAMQSIITHSTYEFSKSSYEITAKAAYAISDAMLNERLKNDNARD